MRYIFQFVFVLLYLAGIVTAAHGTASVWLAALIPPYSIYLVVEKVMLYFHLVG